MLTLAPLLALAVAAHGADTTFQVTRGDRLEAHVFAGSLTIEAWDRNEVQVTGLDGRDRGATHRGSVVRVSLNPGRYSNGVGDVRVRVPAWMAVEGSGVETDLVVRGVAAAVKLNTVEGDVTVEGAATEVVARSVEGLVTITGARGRVAAGSVDGDVSLRNISGEARVESVDGDITVRGSDLTGLEATTVDGDVSFSGPVKAGGSYRLNAHDGAITVALGSSPNVEVRLSTWDGDLESDFPVTVTGAVRGNRAMTFTLGQGAARLTLESFDGKIRLVRTLP